MAKQRKRDPAARRADDIADARAAAEGLTLYDKNGNVVFVGPYGKTRETVRGGNGEEYEVQGYDVATGEDYRAAGGGLPPANGAATGFDPIAEGGEVLPRNPTDPPPPG